MGGGGSVNGSEKGFVFLGAAGAGGETEEAASVCSQCWGGAAHPAEHNKWRKVHLIHFFTDTLKLNQTSIEHSVITY